MNERDWIPAHRRLFRGAKKGLPRAVRFVFLELCHEARLTHGMLEFPPEWDTLTAVHDRIGGSRREIRKALTLFQIPDKDGLATIKIVRDRSEHRLEIVKWWTWCGPKSDAERSETHRKQVLENSNALHRKPGVTPTGQEKTEQYRREETRAPESSPEEPRTSERRLKSVPPPPPEPAEQARIRDAILAEPKLSDLDAADLASEALTTMMAKGFKLEWMLQAVRDAASKSERGELRHIRHGRLIGFFRRAKPKSEAAPGENKGGSAYRDFPIDPTSPPPSKRRRTAQDLPPVEHGSAATFAAAIAGIGRPALGEPMTEQQLQDKARADRDRLEALERETGT